MKSKVFAFFLWLLLLENQHISEAASVQESSNNTAISREQTSSFIDYFTLLVTTNDQLQTKINTLASAKKSLEGQLVNAESKIHNDTLLINTKDQEIKDQREQIRERDDQVKDKNEKLHLQDEQIKEKSEKLRERDEKIKDLDEHLRDQDKKMYEQDVELQERSDQVNNMTEVIESLKILVISGESRITNCSDQLKKLDEQLKGRNEQVLKQSEQVKSLSEEIQSLKSKIDDNSLVINAKDLEIMEHKEQIQKRDEQVQEKNEQLDLQDKQLKGQSEELNEREENVNNMTDFIHNLQSQLDMEIKEHHVQITKRENEINNLTYQIQNKDEMVTNMTENIHSLKSQLVDAETQLKEKHELVNLKEKDLKKQDEQLRNHNEQIRKQNEQIKEISEQLKLKDGLLDVKKSEINIQRGLIMNNENIISSLDNQIKSIKADLSNKTNKLLICSAVEQCPIGRPSGISSIKLPGDQAFEAPCNSSGWMTIQKRFDGSENFNRSWISYKEGFGNIRGEFFIGLEKLHQLTQAQPYELLIRLGDKSGASSHAHFDDFKVGSENEAYYLKSLGKFSGTTVDGLRDHLQMMFSTYDQDNDLFPMNCAKNLGGGWWFKKCGTSALNGKYYESGGNVTDGIFWPFFHGGKWINNISFTFVEIMIKQKNN